METSDLQSAPDQPQEEDGALSDDALVEIADTLFVDLDRDEAAGQA